MALFEDLSVKDVIFPILREIEAGKLSIVREGDEFSVRGKMHNVSVTTSWINHGDPSPRDCVRWQMLYFHHYGFIPKECFGCWKVVVKISKLKQLMDINRAMEKMPYFCKCGIEERPYARYKTPYQAFFYAPLGCTLKEAQEFHREISTKVYHILPLGTPVVLKRGCTEMENRFGPSENWTTNPLWAVKQEVLDEIIELDVSYGQPQFIKNFIMMRWIMYAMDNRDETAKLYVDDMDKLMNSVPTTLYHDVAPPLACPPEAFYADPEV